MDRLDPILDGGLDLVEGPAVIEQRLQFGVEVIEGAERARDDDQPAAGAEYGAEGTEYGLGAAVGDGNEVVGLLDLRAVRGERADGVRDDDVDSAVLRRKICREIRDGLGIGDVEDATFDLGGSVDPLGRVGDPLGSRPVRSTRSPASSRSARPSTSAKPMPWFAPVTRAMR